MKKGVFLAVTLAIVLCAGMAMATGGGYFPPYTPPDVTGSGEAQAFVNQETVAAQGFVTQEVKECGFHYTVDTEESASIEAYGSIHKNPDTLFFGKAKITYEYSSDVGNVFRTVNAQLDQMQSSVKMAADAGASAAFDNLAVAGNASGTQTFNQTQLYAGPVGNGGLLLGTQTYTGTTVVNTFAGN